MSHPLIEALPREYQGLSPRRFGYEMEVADDAYTFLEALQTVGLTNHYELHPYHCGCSECHYDRHTYDFAAQEDCTVNGEFITRILTLGQANRSGHWSALQRARTIAWTARPGWEAGNHVHVSKDVGEAYRTRMHPQDFVWLYGREYARLAQGAFDSVRDYNSPPAYLDGSRSYDNSRTYGSWVVDHGQTWEFRLWNSTAVAWRARLYVEVSLATVDMLARLTHEMSESEVWRTLFAGSAETVSPDDRYIDDDDFCNCHACRPAILNPQAPKLHELLFPFMTPEGRRLYRRQMATTNLNMPTPDNVRISPRIGGRRLDNPKLDLLTEQVYFHEETANMAPRKVHVVDVSTTSGHRLNTKKGW